MTKNEIQIKTQKTDDNKFYVVAWSDGSILAEHVDEKKARKDARGRGFADDYGPVAFVGQRIEIHGRETFGVVYNPRFRSPMSRGGK